MAASFTCSDQASIASSIVTYACVDSLRSGICALTSLLDEKDRDSAVVVLVALNATKRHAAAKVNLGAF